MSARRSTPTNTTPRTQDAPTGAASDGPDGTSPHQPTFVDGVSRPGRTAPAARGARERHALTGSRTRRSLQLMGRGMRSQWRVYVLAITASALFGATTVLISLAVGRVTDEVVVPALAGDADARGNLWVAGLVLVAIALTLALTVAGRRIFAGYGYANIQAGHRTAVTHQYLRLPMSWHRAHPAGQLLSNANSDVEAATGVFNPLPFALGVVVMIGVSAVMLFRIDVWLACAALVVIPVAIVVNVVFQKYMSPAITHAQQLRAEVSDVAHESFEAALLVKSLGTEAREERRFAARTDELRAANVRVGVVRAFFDPVIELLPSLGTLLVLGVGAARVAAGAVDTGEVVTAAYLLTIMAVPVRAFGWVLGELPRALVGYERIASVLDAPGIPVAGEQRLPATTGGASVRFEGVGVDVRAGGRDVTLLDDIELDLAPGRTVAVVGPTGAGKTTLVSLLARLSDPTRGRVLVDGVDVREALAADLTSQVALVAQSTFIFEDTVRSNVTSRCGSRCAWPRTTTWSPACRVVSTRPWASAAPTCRAVSGSGSRSRVPWCALRACWCSTTRPPPSTPAWSSRSSLACAGREPRLRAQARRRTTPRSSWSPTACRASRSRTRSSTSSRGGWSTSGRTPSCSRATPATASSPRPTSERPSAAPRRTSSTVPGSRPTTGADLPTPCSPSARTSSAASRKRPTRSCATPRKGP